mmetsp:Transcript_114909/g.320104  ORF Transcript_114909/g.320104 Transcript_114909/m.320104 type:complete len:254 (-) Transcript_114909:88-849(-)
MRNTPRLLPGNMYFGSTMRWILRNRSRCASLSDADPLPCLDSSEASSSWKSLRWKHSMRSSSRAWPSLAVNSGANDASAWRESTPATRNRRRFRMGSKDAHGTLSGVSSLARRVISGRPSSAARACRTSDTVDARATASLRSAVPAACLTVTSTGSRSESPESAVSSGSSALGATATWGAVGGEKSFRVPPLIFTAAASCSVSASSRRIAAASFSCRSAFSLRNACTAVVSFSLEAASSFSLSAAFSASSLPI